MKLSHREKLRLARKNLTPLEISLRTAPFASSWWDDHKYFIREKVKMREAQQALTKKLRLDRLAHA